MTAFNILAEAEDVTLTHLANARADAHETWQEAHVAASKAGRFVTEAYTTYRRALELWAAEYTREQEALEELRRIHAIDGVAHLPRRECAGPQTV